MAYTPRVFIGSSTAGKAIAQALESKLKSVMQVQLWFKSTFQASRTIIEDLERIARSEVDLAVLILTPDDTRNRGRGRQRVPRDNVLFELGLFMGALGRGRTFGVTCGHCDIDLPTDLSGITWLEYLHPHEQEAQYGADPVGLLDTLANSVSAVAAEIIDIAADLKLEPVRAAGSRELVKAYPMRGLVTRPEWNGIIRDSKQQLWLYGMAELGYAEDDAVPGILRAAAQQDCDIRILLLDPSYSGSAGIDLDEGKPSGTLAARTRASLAHFSRASESCQGRLKIRTYNFPPVVSIVRGDERMLVTPYVRFLIGSNSPTFDLEHVEADGMFARYARHFEHVWVDAKEWTG